MLRSETRINKHYIRKSWVELAEWQYAPYIFVRVSDTSYSYLSYDRISHSWEYGFSNDLLEDNDRDGYIEVSLLSSSKPFDRGTPGLIWTRGKKAIFEVEKEKEMSRKDVNYIGGEYNVVKVAYVDDMQNKPYNFKIDVDLKVEEGDLLVVEASTGFGLVKVKELLENTIHNAKEVKKATAWVVDKVDTSRQDQRREATEKQAWIIQRLEERQAQLSAVQMYEVLAQNDPQAKKLLDELKELPGTINAPKDKDE